jgi:hypothetical protein
MDAARSLPLLRAVLLLAAMPVAVAATPVVGAGGGNSHASGAGGGRGGHTYGGGGHVSGFSTATHGLNAQGVASAVKAVEMTRAPGATSLDPTHPVHQSQAQVPAHVTLPLPPLAAQWRCVNLPRDLGQAAINDPCEVIFKTIPVGVYEFDLPLKATTAAPKPPTAPAAARGTVAAGRTSTSEGSTE